MRIMLLLSFLTMPVAAHAEDEDYPKLGPNAVSILADHAYLTTAPAPDYWAFAPFVKPQFTSSACSIATVTAALNGLRGQPAMASETIMTQQNLLDLTGSPEWAALSAEDGDGVTFDQFTAFTLAAMTATGMTNRPVTPWQPGAATDDTLTALRKILADNEASADDAVMIYFNQGVVTGDWDGPHISLIGAYDAAQDRVLILEVDQEWYVPYWTPVPVLLDAMVKPAPAEQGVLEGQIGGTIVIGAPT